MYNIRLKVSIRLCRTHVCIIFFGLWLLLLFIMLLFGLLPHTQTALVVTKRVLRKAVLIPAAWETLLRRSIFTFIFRLLPSAIRSAHQQTPASWHAEGLEQQLCWPRESRKSDVKQTLHFSSHGNNTENMATFLCPTVNHFSLDKAATEISCLPEHQQGRRHSGWKRDLYPNWQLFC